MSVFWKSFFQNGFQPDIFSNAVINDCAFYLFKQGLNMNKNEKASLHQIEHVFGFKKSSRPRS